MMLTACKSTGLDLASSVSKTEQTPFEAARPGEYDSSDTSVITKVSEINKAITFYNYDLEKSYTLNYDSVTGFYDKYGTALTVSQITPGLVVDVEFLKVSKLLTKVKVNSEAFSISDISDFSVDYGTKVFRYKDDAYKISNATILISDNETVDISDIDPIDVVTVSGFDTSIYSVTVTKSHGYLKVTGTDSLLGGYIDIGTKQVEKISPNLSVTLPVGDYNLLITKGKTEEARKVTIKDHEETVLNLSDIEVEEEKFGKVLFDVNPSDANVYVDGKKIDNAQLLTLPYGMHKVEATKEGYDYISRYFNVGEEKATLALILDANDVSSNNTSTDESSETEGYFVFISSPSGVEVTIDGNYIGIAPLSVAKKAGTHTISLRKNGCVSRTYTVLIENTAKDVYYNFEELAADTSVSTNDSSSGQ